MSPHVRRFAYVLPPEGAFAPWERPGGAQFLLGHSYG